MKLNDLRLGLEKLQGTKYDNLEVIVETSPGTTPICALVVVDNPTKYRYTHIRFASDLASLVQDLLLNYPLSEEDLPHCVIPIAGFSTIDLVNLL